MTVQPMEHYVDKYNAEVKQLIYSGFGIHFAYYSDVFRCHGVLASNGQEIFMSIDRRQHRMCDSPMNYICFSEDDSLHRCYYILVSESCVLHFSSRTCWRRSALMCLDDITATLH